MEKMVVCIFCIVGLLKNCSSDVAEQTGIELKFAPATGQFSFNHNKP